MPLFGSRCHFGKAHIIASCSIIFMCVKVFIVDITMPTYEKKHKIYMLFFLIFLSRAPLLPLLVCSFSLGKHTFLHVFLFC